jgi:hypothetical protein
MTDQQPKHQPMYMAARGRCWAHCSCGWQTNPNISGNQMWAQQEYVKHLAEQAKGEH